MYVSNRTCPTRCYRSVFGTAVVFPQYHQFRFVQGYRSRMENCWRKSCCWRATQAQVADWLSNYGTSNRTATTDSSLKAGYGIGGSDDIAALFELYGTPVQCIIILERNPRPWGMSHAWCLVHTKTKLEQRTLAAGRRVEHRG